MSLKKSLAALAAVLGFALFAGPAMAQFKVCNKAEGRQSVAIAYKTGDTWVSEGWWLIEEGDCKTVVGGDLKNRYYYYRATVNGGGFSGQDYFFCTVTEAFTIEGKTDCEGRGYRKEEFAEVDTGKTAKSFTLNLVPPKTASATKQDGSGKSSQQADQAVSNSTTTSTTTTQSTTQQSNPAPQPGSLGEPYTVNAMMQGCDYIDGSAVCLFYANGWRWFVYDGQGTPQGVMNQLEGLAPGDLVTISGDVLNYGDISAEVTAYSVQARQPFDENENTMAGLQGKWLHAEGRTMWEIVGAEIYEYYDGEGVSESFFYIADDCPAADGRQGPFFVRVIPEAYEDPDCYFLLGWDAEFLQLAWAQSVNGQTQDFWKQYD